MEEIGMTHLIIGFTVLFSLWGFNNPHVFEQYKHYPYAEKRRGEYIRMLTAGFLHGDYMHLAFNMWALYIFGPIVERFFEAYLPLGRLMFVLFYVAAIVMAGLPTYYKHQNHSGFASIGASGAVSAVVFAGILFQPLMGIGLIFLPGIFIPGFLFGILYLWYSVYASNHSRDNIDHIAHYAGAVFGFFFPILFKPTLFAGFAAQVMESIQGYLS